MPAGVGGLGCGAEQVAAGARHTLALDASNQVWAFGNGEEGQLGTGNGAAASHSSPMRVVGLLPMAVAFVQARGDHSIAVLRQPRNGEPALPGARGSL
jgi:alpha-tubulin suppressor-like RCC1 family protein